jgi:hypothetical protein
LVAGSESIVLVEAQSGIANDRHLGFIGQISELIDQDMVVERDMFGNGREGDRRRLPVIVAASVRTGERSDVAQRDDPESHHFT